MGEQQFLRRSHGPNEFLVLGHRQLQAFPLTSSSRRAKSSSNSSRDKSGSNSSSRLVKSSSRDKINSNSLQGPRGLRPKRTRPAKHRRLSLLPRRRLHVLPRRTSLVPLLTQ
jgi:hypothetical protein